VDRLVEAVAVVCAPVVVAGMLLAALVLILSQSVVSAGGMTFRDLAKLGESFYVAVIGPS